MFIFHDFSALLSDLEHESVVLVLGELVLVFDDALDDLSIESLMSVNALLYVHDDLAIGLLERFFLFGGRFVSFAIFIGSHVLVGSVCEGSDT